MNDGERVWRVKVLRDYSEEEKELCGTGGNILKWAMVIHHFPSFPGDHMNVHAR